MKKILIHSVLCILLNLFLTAASFGVKSELGLLWQIETPQGKKSTLFGTMHLMDDSLKGVLDKLHGTLNKARVVYIEYTINEKDLDLINTAVLKTRNYINRSLSPEIYHNLVSLMADYQIPLELYERASPFLISSMILNPTLFTQPQMDFIIMEKARSLRIPVFGLEEAEAVIKRVQQFDNTYFLPTIHELLEKPQQLPHHIKHIKGLYLNERIKDILFTLHDTTISPNDYQPFINSVIYERNQIMFAVARDEIEKGGVLMAVGAAHLAGEQGLLALFEDAGYKVTRIAL